MLQNANQNLGLAAPALVLAPDRPLLLTRDGEIARPNGDGVAREARLAPPLICHLPAFCRRLAIGPFPALDLLELFAFVLPGRACVPTPRGLAAALELPRPETPEAEALSLRRSAAALLAEADCIQPRQAGGLAFTLAREGWSWAPLLLQALGFDETPAPAARGFAVWERLPRWQDQGPPPPAGQEGVGEAEARRALAALRGAAAEDRPQQADYASALATAFQPPPNRGDPTVVLAEAGTGVGKTLGYLVPAGLWAERNEGSVQLSTFTRALQGQLEREVASLYPDPKERAAKVAVRKGRENYLCLLNFAEAVAGSATRPGDLLALALMARWAPVSRDGDMVGSDFPGWLPDLVGRTATLGLTDRRGECVYAACEHYRRCFVERSQRRAKRARLVISNHALTLAQAAGALDEQNMPQRLVFDEGHHLFEAADEAFSLQLSGRETQDLRRWLTGGEGGRTAWRLRGLKRRIEDLVLDDRSAAQALQEVLVAAAVLPGEGWRQRIAGGAPRGAAEGLLAAVARQVEAYTAERDEGYDIECDSHPVQPGVLIAARALDKALIALAQPLKQLAQRLRRRLEEEPERLDSDQRKRLEGSLRGIERRALVKVEGWRHMLAALEDETPPGQIDWMAIARSDGRAVDVGLHRHWLDPMEPFAETVLSTAHGVAITSATLTGAGGEGEAEWARAERRCGTGYLPRPALRVRVASPFDYAAQARVFIVCDLDKRRPERQASALAGLFEAAGGGALGLFTAIVRLKAVHCHLAPRLAAAGLPLLAQHVDPLDTGTLVDIFRSEPESCLLGTDALRDGIDVPGDSLRILIYDRVPWPRADIRHRERRKAFGMRAYDEEIVRRRLRQAFGRLIRRADDRGVFAILDSAFPSRFLAAFPDKVPVSRCGLAEAIAETRNFLTRSPETRRAPPG
ncbi:MAG: ATP-dependent DNA helicase [Rhodospirillales bacterium]|nr:ATP-dependent DNA helicase [Rhodospirillales bacterium]